MRRMSEDLRRHPRYRLALRVELDVAGETVSASTVGISRSGISLRLSPPPAMDERLPLRVQLPDGGLVVGRGQVKSLMPGCICGLSLVLDGEAQARWDSFLDEEEATGSLWRMIGRFARDPSDENAPRGIVERGPRAPLFKSIDLDDPTLSYHRDEETAVLRFHTVGENGEAYRVAFEKHASDEPDRCDLAAKLPGFKEQARRAVLRVLREEMILRFDESSPTVKARVCELKRGGYAYVQGDGAAPVGLVSLAVGELMLVSMNGKTVFPHFDEADLERVACDTFRHDMPRAVFSSSPPRAAEAAPAEVPRAVTLPPTSIGPASAAPPAGKPLKFQEGLDAIVFAQAASENVQTRRYGDREIHFHPGVWAKLVDENGAELMGPTLQDDGHACLLALVGPGAPRVVRIMKTSRVRLMKSPGGR